MPDAPHPTEGELIMQHNATDLRDSSGAPLEDDATYAAFLLTSLRANAGMHQHAIVSGATAKTMIANSSDARLLHFERI